VADTERTVPTMKRLLPALWVVLLAVVLGFSAVLLADVVCS
jgi:hypothetical protein